MIHIPFLLPLLVAGFTGGAWREYRHGRELPRLVGLPGSVMDKSSANLSAVKSGEEFDDIGELHHYQKVSWYSLAFAASGSLFYPPVTLVCVPLLGYNAYHFARLLRHTDAAGRKSPMTVFEGVTLTATLVTGQLTTASVMFLLTFGSRKLLLQAGNIADIGFSQVIDPRFARVWVLRDGVEIESSLREVQVNDVLVVRGGETVLLAGKVLDGEGVVRQYSLLKKPKLIKKYIGDKVFPFTQLESGCLHIRQL